MENIKPALKVFVKLIAVTIFCFFVAISVMVICNGFGTEKIGYTAFGVTEKDDEFKELYTHYYADGEDKLEKEYTDKGYALQKVTIRSEFEGAPKNIFLIVTQFIGIVILIGFTYHYIWELGAADANLVKFNHKTLDKLRGFKIGLLASIPNIIFFAIIVIFQKGFMSGFNIQMYKFAVGYFYSFIELILKGAMLPSDLSIVQYLLLGALLLIVPLVTQISYVLGLKGISLEEKFIYKKEKE
ncbi:MAG: hypothetical protein IJN15_00520 [Clostridia bacterium]|nr:hypothetical protein [Clostridia bacterium]